jgi:anaerobic selenocysteine-containing dehydrogenase
MGDNATWRAARTADVWACVLCSNGCGLDVAVANGRIVGVRGRARDRINHGRLGPRLEAHPARLFPQCSLDGR